MRSTRWPVLMLLLAACPSPEAPDESGPVALAARCEATDLPDAPLVLLDEIDTHEFLFSEALAVERQQGTDLAWFAGVGGLWAVEVGEDGTTMRGFTPFEEWFTAHRFARLSVSADGVGFATDHDRSELFVFDLSSPEDILGLKSVDLGAGPLTGMARNGDLLYVLGADGVLHVVDVSVPHDPVRLRTLRGLGSPLAAVVEGSTLYIADQELGLIEGALGDPEKPLLDRYWPLTGALDLTVSDHAVYVATGSDGVAVFGRTPTRWEGRVELPGAIGSVSVGGAQLWATNQLEAWLVDVTEPYAPQPVGAYEREQWTMDVLAWGDGAVVADWAYARHFEGVPTAEVPALVVPRAPGWFAEDDPTGTVTVRNLGRAPLELQGFCGPEGVEVSVPSATVAPGASTEVTFAGLNALGDGGTIELVTNDPAQGGLKPTVWQQVANNGFFGLGLPSPTFELPVLGGGTEALTSAPGEPVVVFFFSTWCPQCVAEVRDIENHLWPAYRDRGVRILGISYQEEASVVAEYADTMGLTFPILLDLTGDVHAAWPLPGGFTVDHPKSKLGSAPFPRTFVIAPDGTLVYANDVPDRGALETVLEGLLSAP